MSTRNFPGVGAGQIERRVYASEIRIAGDEFAIAGYAAKYNVLSHDLDGFREKIAAGAFKRSLMEGADVVCLFNHDPSRPLGRTTNGTLRLEEKPDGLWYYCKLNPSNSEHKVMHENIRTGLINQCSFAFTVPQGGDLWETGRDDAGKECQIRTLLNVDLLDCSPVTYPAYPTTNVGARKNGYGRKQRVGGSNLDLQESAQHWHGDVARMLALLDKTAHALGRALTHSEAQALLRSCPNCAGGGDDVAAIRGHMEMCASLLDCALATAGTAQDIMDGDDWDDDKEEDSMRSTSSTYQSNRKKIRELHRQFHRMLGECCGLHANARITVDQIFD
jgi:HK97 family phage prohead protease